MNKNIDHMDKTNNTQKDIVVMGIGYVGLATGLSLAVQTEYICGC